MGTVASLIRNLNTLDLGSEVVEAVKETAQDFIDINTEGQLLQGTNASGGLIKPNYADKYYARKKAIMNPLPGFGTPDLKLTGEFYKRFEIGKVDTQQIEIKSDVDYAQYLEAKYSENIYGLNDTNRPKYTFGAFFEALKKRITNVTGLNFS